MSTTFTEFLREQAAKEAAAYGNVKEIVEEWRGAVENLFRQLRAWLAASDPDGLIGIRERQHEVWEPHLGYYSVPRLDLQAFGTRVGVVPKARLTMATATPPRATGPQQASGLVEITDAMQRFFLFRFRGDDGDVWTVESAGGEPKPLNQEAFEKVLLSCLR